jgi:SAM-dependent methyltransferase
MNYTDRNAEAIDSWVENGWEWGVPITHEAFLKAKKGEWSVFLTPTRPVPKEWFPDLAGCRVLGLASGGAQQMPVFAALGAECTVLDYSKKQLESERLTAEREGYDIRIVRADMTKPLPFEDGAFDLIFHPVANCYIEEVLPVWRECHRVLKKGGVLLAGMDNGINFLFDEGGTELKHSLPFNPLKDPDLQKKLEGTNDSVQFSHTMDEQLRGQIQAGFTLRDLYEDYDNVPGPLREHHVPTFWATMARKE